MFRTKFKAGLVTKVILKAGAKEIEIPDVKIVDIFVEMLEEEIHKPRLEYATTNQLIWEIQSRLQQHNLADKKRDED